MEPARLQSLVLFRQGPAISDDKNPSPELVILGISTSASPSLAHSLPLSGGSLSVGQANLILFVRVPPSASLEGP